MAHRPSDADADLSREKRKGIQEGANGTASQTNDCPAPVGKKPWTKPQIDTGPLGPPPPDRIVQSNAWVLH
jgi:hypothetical protein